MAYHSLAAVEALRGSPLSELPYIVRILLESALRNQPHAAYHWNHVEALAGWAPIVTAVTLLCAGFILKWAWFSDTPPDVIYYPPLDQELRDKEREARGLC